MSNRILVIGEAFGAEEEKQGKAFVGRSGQLLRRALTEAGYNLDLIDFNNVCMWRPPNNRKPIKAEINKELPRLVALMEKYEIVFLMGKTAFNSLWLLIPNNVGIKLGFYHPSYVLRGGLSYKRYVEDFRRCGAIYLTSHFMAS